MKADMIKRLLQSPIYEDVIIALNLMKGYTFQDVKNLGIGSPSYGNGYGMTLNFSYLFRHPDNPSYIINEGLYCHTSPYGCIWFYPRRGLNEIKYTKL